MNTAASTKKIPPETFNLMPRPFRPGAAIARTAELEQVEALVKAGRLRSAMDLVLAVLDKDPENQHALWSAMIIFGAVSRTKQVNAAEALDDRYWRDSRLDRVFATCSRCRVRSWVPDECLYDFQAITVRNPVGLQCKGCG